APGSPRDRRRARLARLADRRRRRTARATGADRRVARSRWPLARCSGGLARVDAIRAHHGVDGAVRFQRTSQARSRTCVGQPRGGVVVVTPAQVATPAERFTVLHELGHVLAALALPAGIPRIVDEAAAAFVARAIEREGEPWFSAGAAAARA